jgi:hypothetical protein
MLDFNSILRLRQAKQRAENTAIWKRLFILLHPNGLNLSAIEEEIYFNPNSALAMEVATLNQ